MLGRSVLGREAREVELQRASVGKPVAYSRSVPVS